VKTERLAKFLVTFLSVALMCCGLRIEAQAAMFSEVASSVSPNSVDQWWYYNFSLQVRNDSAGELILTTETTFRMEVDATHYFQVPLSHETVVAAGTVASLEFGRDRVCGCLTAGPYNPTLSLAGHDAAMIPFTEVMVTSSNPVTINYFQNDSGDSIGAGPSTKSFRLPPAGTVIGPFTVSSSSQTVPWGIKAEAGPSDYLEILVASNPPNYGDTYLDAPLSPEVPLPEIITDLAPDERLPYYAWVRPKAGATLEAGQTYPITLYIRLMRSVCPHDGGVIIAAGVGLLLDATYDLTPLHTVSFSQAGPGSGHVDINGYGWSLPFSRLYFEGSGLTVTPKAHTGSRFDHWEGDLSGVDNPITFTVSGNLSAAPYFALRTYTLSLAGSHGTVRVDGTEYSLPWSGTFSYESHVSLEALPAPECQFQRWSGAISTTDNPTSVTITGDATVTAEFVVPPLPAPFADDLSTNRPWTYAGHWERGPAVSGGGDPGSDHSPSSDNYLLGYVIGERYGYNESEVPVTSPPVDCSDATHVALSFWRWLRLGNGGDHAAVRVSIDGSTWSDVWSAAGPIADASWTYCEYDLTSVAAGQPSVQVRFVHGPTDGVTIDGGWSIDDFSLRAQNALSVSGTDGAVKVDSVSHALPWSGLLDHGAVVTLEAVPDSGYLFSNWSGDLTGSANPDTITMDGDKSISASFIAHVFSVTANPPSPSTVASAGSTSLSAGFSDTGGHGVGTWSWDDGGAGGSFSPSASVQSPTYTAVANTTDSDRVVTLTVSGTCDGFPPLGDSDSTTLTVQPVAHTLEVLASADPMTVASGGSTSLTASYLDSRRAHIIAAWSWDDDGASGTFSPSGTVWNPSYTAPVNTGETDLLVTLTVTGICNGPGMLSDSDVVNLTVQPAAPWGQPIPEVLLEVHPNERAPGSSNGQVIGGNAWTRPAHVPGAMYWWKHHRFVGSDALWIQVCAQNWNAIQNGTGDDDNIRLRIDGFVPVDYDLIQNGPWGAYQWKGSKENGHRWTLRFLYLGASPLPVLHALQFEADETPVIWWIKVTDLEPEVLEAF
jgi:hypothetical protein